MTVNVRGSRRGRPYISEVVIVLVCGVLVLRRYYERSKVNMEWFEQEAS